MSYSIAQAKGEERTVVEEAVFNGDEITIMRVANHYAKLGDDEKADYFLNLAAQVIREDYDEYKQERDDYQRESEQLPAEGNDY